MLSPSLTPARLQRTAHLFPAALSAQKMARAASCCWSLSRGASIQYHMDTVSTAKDTAAPAGLQRTAVQSPRLNKDSSSKSNQLLLLAWRPVHTSIHAACICTGSSTQRRLHALMVVVKAAEGALPVPCSLAIDSHEIVQLQLATCWLTAACCLPWSLQVGANSNTGLLSPLQSVSGRQKTGGLSSAALTPTPAPRATQCCWISAAGCHQCCFMRLACKLQAVCSSSGLLSPLQPVSGLQKTGLLSPAALIPTQTARATKLLLPLKCWLPSVLLYAA